MGSIYVICSRQCPNGDGIYTLLYALYKYSTSITNQPTKGDPALVDMWRTSHQNMKYQSSLRRRVITGGSQKDVRVSRRMDCRIGVIQFHVSANN